VAKPKRVKVQREPKPKRRATTREIDPHANRREPVTWRLAEIDFDGIWGWAKLANADMPVLHAQLVALEQQTFAQLSRDRIAKWS
jgi:hypothetical protein